MDFVGTALITFGLLWAGGFGLAHARAAAKATAATSWPATIGKVISTEVRVEKSRDHDGRRTTWYNPVVRYAYVAAGRSLEGHRLRFGNLRSTKRAAAEAAIAPYVVGSSTAVRYNPDKPEDAVLETVKPGPTYLIMASAGLGFVGFGLFWNNLTG